VNRRSGFSLGELVTIVIVVALLTTILFPVFAQSKNGGWNRCVHKIRVLGLSETMYAADWNECLPPASTWADKSAEHVPDKSAFKCPDLKDAGPDKFGHAFATVCGGRKASSFESQADTILIFDSKNLAWNANGGLTDVALETSRKSGRLGIAWLDGHATTRSRIQMFGAFRNEHRRKGG
jgi:hypothetical protein